MSENGTKVTYEEGSLDARLDETGDPLWNAPIFRHLSQWAGPEGVGWGGVDGGHPDTGHRGCVSSWRAKDVSSRAATLVPKLDPCGSPAGRIGWGGSSPGSHCSLLAPSRGTQAATMVLVALSADQEVGKRNIVRHKGTKPTSLKCGFHCCQYTSAIMSGNETPGTRYKIIVFDLSRISSCLLLTSPIPSPHTT